MTAPQPPYPHYPAAPPRARRVGRPSAGTVVTVVLAGVIVVCLGLGATGYFLVARAAPGADSPAGAANGLLTALFHSGSEDDLGRYVCGEKRDSQSIQQLLTQTARYRQGDGTVRWAKPRQTGRHDDSATVTAKLTLTSSANGKSQHGTQRWKLGTVDENGWRVCTIKMNH